MAIATLSQDAAAAAQRPVARASALGGAGVTTVPAATSAGASAGTSASPSAAPSPDMRDPVTVGGHDGHGVEIKGEMSFWDFLDIINPLQHIPIVSTIYREVTGDTIKPAEQVMGGILYGGVIGGLASIANAAVEESQGKGLDQQLVAALGFGGDQHGASDAEMAGRMTTIPGSTGPGGTGETQVAALPGAATAPAGSAAATATAAGAPVRLFAGAAQAGPTAQAQAQAAAGGPLGAKVEAQLAAQRMADGASRDALTGAGQPHPSRMPARDTPLASSALAKHMAPRFAGTLPGGTTARAQAAGLSAAALAAQTQALQAQATQAKALEAQAQSAETPTPENAGATSGAAANDASAAPVIAPAAPVPVSPAMLPDAMMRNLQKYEQSRKNWQSSAPAMNLAS